MPAWEYCEVDFDGEYTFVWFYDEAGAYIDRAFKSKRLGISLATLGHDGWEIVTTWWRSSKQVTYMLKRPRQMEWTDADRGRAVAEYKTNHPRG